MRSLRRFTTHAAPGNPMVLPLDHPAVVNATSYFSRSANQDRASGRVLISAVNQRKIGRRILKGAWKGMEVYTLTLQERATCPRSCRQWRSCYGNRMPWSIRQPHGPELEAKLMKELAQLSARHPMGFVVRLHILGDFYSVEYVGFWLNAMDRFKGLHIFGYTARTRNEPTGIALQAAISQHWSRFAIRASGGGIMAPKAIVVPAADAAGDAIVCPAQTGRTACCSTCGLCWSTTKTIAFLEH